jgi:O-acetyl-ADP-ribose deacetylase (regulator of RNase III)
MLELANRDNVTAIALPAIGAGLGGLKWDDVKAILNKVSNDYPNVNLYVVETYQGE